MTYIQDPDKIRQIVTGKIFTREEISELIHDMGYNYLDRQSLFPHKFFTCIGRHVPHTDSFDLQHNDPATIWVVALSPDEYVTTIRHFRYLNGFDPTGDDIINFHDQVFGNWEPIPMPDVSIYSEEKGSLIKTIFVLLKNLRFACASMKYVHASHFAKYASNIYQGGSHRLGWYKIEGNFQKCSLLDKNHEEILVIRQAEIKNILNLQLLKMRVDPNELTSPMVTFGDQISLF